jgi:hypothetical protein
LTAKFLPLKLFSAYIVFGVVVAVFGPVNYIEFKPFEVSLYMACFLILFTLGYTAGITVSVPAGFHRIASHRVLGLQVVKFCIAVSFLYKCQELAALAIAGNLNLSLDAIGEAYVNLYADYTRGSGTYQLAYILSIFFYLPLQVTLILGVYHFRSLSATYRLLVIGTILLLVLVNVVGQGKQKQFGDVLIFALSVLVLKIGAYQRRKSRFVLTAFAVGTAGMVFLMLVLYSRYSALEIDIANINKVTHPLLEYDATHPLFTLLGDAVGFPAAVFCMYLTGGYQGLSLSFDQPFIWTHGVGHSYALTTLLDKVFGLPVSVADSYPYRVGAATGWDEAKWHSVFSWLASDLTFAGAVVVFFFVAYVYAQCWKEAVLHRNPASIMLFSVLNLGLAFVPANNQLLHSPESYLSIIVVLAVWISTRHVFNARATPAPYVRLHPHSLSAPQ